MELAYQIYGEGPTLILVHGIVHRQAAWAPVIDLLAPHRRVITVDLPGHGDSPPLPPGKHVMHRLADYLYDFVNDIAEPGQKPHIAGNSLGGWLALEMAARGAVASATGISPAGFWVNELDQKRAEATFTGLRTVGRMLGPASHVVMNTRLGRSLALGVFFGRPWRVPKEAAAMDFDSLMTSEIVDMVVGADFTFTPMKVDTPITVLWGGEDLVLPVYEAKQVTKVFPKARVIIIPWVGHVPMVDDPEKVAAILRSGSHDRGSMV